jgi:protein phosphatase 1 regulatory subunit 11
MSSNSKRNDCDGEHDGHTHNHDHGSRTGKRKVRGNRASSPNAYEKMPKVKGGGSGSGSATMLEKS